MKILVTVKRVVDYESKLKLNADKTQIATDDVNWIINPFDEIALEEALRLKEKHGAEVCVVSVGQAEVSQQIRNALALGADRGILIVTNEFLDTSAIAEVLAWAIKEEKPDLVLMGKQAVDDDSHQVGEILAEHLNWGQATQANQITISDKVAKVVREVDGGLETMTVSLPCVITADLRLNEPRYASLPGIMKAKKKPIEEKNLADLGLDLTPKVRLKQLKWPAQKQVGQKIKDAATLVEKLHLEAKVI